MPGPPWDDDDPAGRATILANIDKLVRSMRASAGVRTVPGVAVVQRWHADIYDGCHLPVAGYAGHFRGDPTVAELVGYEVGVGPRPADGYPDRVGLPAAAVRTAVLRLLADLGRAVATLDAHVPTGQRPADPAALQSIAAPARLHRYHPCPTSTRQLPGPAVLPNLVCVTPASRQCAGRQLSTSLPRRSGLDLGIQTEPRERKPTQRLHQDQEHHRPTLRHRRLPSGVSPRVFPDPEASSYEIRDPGTMSVQLQPGHSAYFGIGWLNSNPPCTQLRSLQVTLPSDTQPVDLPVMITACAESGALPWGQSPSTASARAIATLLAAMTSKPAATIKATDSA